jgi:hypothetical protein
MVLFGGPLGDIKVSVGEAGALHTEGLGPEPLRWVQTEPGVFLVAGEDQTIYGGLVFPPGVEGQGQVLLIKNVPYRSYEQVPWYESIAFSAVLLAVCLVVLLSTLALAALAIVLRRRNVQVFHPGAALRRARDLVTLADGLYLLFPLALMLLAADAITYGVTPVVIVVLALPLIATALVVASLIFAVRGWHDQAWGGVIGRVHYGSVMLAAAAVAAWLYTWNLLGFRF